MRKFVMAAVLTLSVLLPAVSQAGLWWRGLLGQGAQVSSPRAWERINFMVAPGVSIVSLLRLQLGIVGDFADTSGSKTDLELAADGLPSLPPSCPFTAAPFSPLPIWPVAAARSASLPMAPPGRAFRLGPDRRVR